MEGKSWSTQQNQATSQFYRVITDNQVPYHVYGGQQDNSAIGIASRTNDRGIDWKDWYSVAGGESAFIAFDPDAPELIYGGTYQGNISTWSRTSRELLSGVWPIERKYVSESAIVSNNALIYQTIVELRRSDVLGFENRK